MSRYVINVPDMSCMHCVNRIHKALSDMGLTDFEVNLHEKTVTLDTEKIAEILDVLDDAGYPAIVREG